MEDSRAWLHAALMRACKLDADTVASLVCYCELANPADAAEYIANIVGHESCMEIVDEYLKRRTTPPPSIISDVGTPMQAYQKPHEQESSWLKNTSTPPSLSGPGRQRNGGRISNPNPNPNPPAAPAAATAPAAAPPTSSKSAASSSRKDRSKGKKGVVTVAEASKMVLNPGKPCDCQAARHELVNNCLSCGKIICLQEGEGPCRFCGALVLREGSVYAGLEGISVMPTSDAEAAAAAFRDRLVEYDRNSASRTTVIDDQSDFFEIDGDSWVSEQEKQLLRKKQKEFEIAEEERKKRVIVTIDLLGRKVVMADEQQQQLQQQRQQQATATTPSSSNPQLLPKATQEQAKQFRVKASPDARELPVFVNTEPSRDRSRDRSTKNTASAAASAASAAVSGRVQYDDEFTEALLARKMELLQIDSAHRHHHHHQQQQQHRKWQAPKLMRESAAFEEASQGFECA